MSGTVSPRLSCSVMLASVTIDPDVETRVGALCDQASEVRGEVVMATGGVPVPDSLARRSNLVWLQDAHAGLFALRRLAADHARGDIVVISEDHCDVPSGWLARVLDSHARHPEADVIIGSVVNGTATTAIDRAAFSISVGPFVAPIDRQAAHAQLPVVGASLKRRALDRLSAACPGMPLELVPGPRLDALGLQFAIDETLCIAHLQSGGWLFHAALHFHNARAVSGSPWHRRRARTWGRLAASPLLLAVRSLRTLRRVSRWHPSTADVFAVVPAVAWLYGSKALGEWSGTVLGPGDSARKVR